MTSKFALNTSTTLVLLCRVAIGMAALQWLGNEGHQSEFIIAITALALTALPNLILRDARLRQTATTVCTVLLAAHITIGMFGGMYETSTLYDKVMHLLGSGAIAYLLMVAVHRCCDDHHINLPTSLFPIVLLCGTLAIGTLWELFEFAVDQFGTFNAQRGLHDTMLDLIANTVGGGIMTTILVVSGVTKRKSVILINPIIRR
jgi:hypothetical protein